MEKTELLKCPFCGGTARVQGRGHETYDYRVYCVECGGSTQSWSHTKEKAAKVWNRRTLSPDNNAPCWCEDCIHVTNEDGLNYLCINKDSIHYDEWVQPQCTCEECVRRATSPGNCTNADRIRAMSDEELAVTLMCPNEMGMAEIPCDHSDGKNCCACLLDWLTQPAEED